MSARAAAQKRRRSAREARARRPPSVARPHASITSSRDGVIRDVLAQFLERPRRESARCPAGSRGRPCSGGPWPQRGGGTPSTAKGPLRLRQQAPDPSVLIIGLRCLPDNVVTAARWTYENRRKSRDLSGNASPVVRPLLRGLVKGDPTTKITVPRCRLPRAGEGV